MCLLYKVFINTLEKIAINAHIVKSARLNRNDGLDGGGRGLDRAFDQYLGKYRDYRTYPKSAKHHPGWLFRHPQLIFQLPPNIDF